MVHGLFKEVSRSWGVVGRLWEMSKWRQRKDRKNVCGVLLWDGLGEELWEQFGQTQTPQNTESLVHSRFGLQRRITL
jgi:hypothetical protein